MTSSALHPRLLILAAAILFSTGGAAVKATTLDGWQVACARSALAALTLAIAVPAARRLGSWKVWLVGVGYAGMLTSFVLANKLTTAANAVFLQSTAPLYLAVLSPWLLRERPDRRDVVTMVGIAIGIVVLTRGDEAATSVASDPGLGNLVAAGMGLAWALTILGLRWLERGAGEERELGAAGALAGNIVAAAVTLPLALPVVSSTPADWWIVSFLGVVQIGLAYAFMTRGLGRVPAVEASLLLFLEPILNPVWAWLVHAERPTGWSLVGGLIILVAASTRAWWSARDASA